MQYLKNLLIALDQLLNAIFAGWPDETMSSRAYRWDVAGVRSWPRKVIDFIADICQDSNHCYESFRSERIGRQQPPELRHGE